jgi:hypothetical protein
VRPLNHLGFHQGDRDHALLIEAVEKVAQDEGLAREILLVRILRRQPVEHEFATNIAGAVAGLPEVCACIKDVIRI